MMILRPGGCFEANAFRTGRESRVVKTGLKTALLKGRQSATRIEGESTAMAGFGRFKLTDALPEPTKLDQSQPQRAGEGSVPARKGKGKGKGGRNKSARRAGELSTSGGLAAEQLREARESAQAKNAEASTRDRMVEIGRGNQQAGRQRAK
jgi:hypothetical protein